MGTSVGRVTHSLGPRVAALCAVGLAIYFYGQLRGTGPDGMAERGWISLLAAAIALIWIVRRRRPTALELVVVEVLTASLAADYQYSLRDPLRDLRLYLDAGAHFVAGTAVYTPDPLSAYPPPGVHLPFLYAPPTLPFFGILSLLPYPLVAAAWVALSSTAVVVALRTFGLSWPWIAAALVWTPIEQGLYVGNVAMPALLIVALAPRVPWLLFLGPLLKPQNGVLALWLVARRDWNEVIRGLVALLATVAATVSLTGIDRWTEWLAGLAAYQQSQGFLPGLYGVGLPRYIPYAAFLGLTAGVCAMAFLARGRELLERFCLASVIASPSLWNFGMAYGLPGYLRLQTPLVLVTAGLLAVGPFPGPQFALLVGVAAWFVPALVRSATDIRDRDAESVRLHPLGAELQAWPRDAGLDAPPTDTRRRERDAPTGLAAG